MNSEGFPPVAAREARVLVLGTLPGPESLRQQQYYAQPRNAFWRIMGALVGAGPELAYRERLEVLVRHRVALWDVCASAVRVGALDAAIQRETIVVNDFARFFDEHPSIRLVCCNGQTAAKLYRRLVVPTLPQYAAIEPHALPSTSPAHAALRFEAKLEAWRVVKEAGDAAQGSEVEIRRAAVHEFEPSGEGGRARVPG